MSYAYGIRMGIVKSCDDSRDRIKRCIEFKLLNLDNDNGSELDTPGSVGSTLNGYVRP
jgi:hypothetical protein